MRHNKKFSHLGRTASHRRAMLANMACSLIMHKRIATTIAKAKALRIYVEPLITKSKDDSTHSRRVVFSLIKQKEAVTELFREIAPKIAERPGGYTRILKTGFRKGDAADMCIIELVDYNENYSQDTKAAAEKPKTRRSRSAATAKKSETVATDAAVLEDSAAEKKPAAEKKTATAKKPVAVKKAAAEKPAKADAVTAVADKDAE